jgi:hypothetical protein
MNLDFVRRVFGSTAERRRSLFNFRLGSERSGRGCDKPPQIGVRNGRSGSQLSSSAVGSTAHRSLVRYLAHLVFTLLFSCLANRCFAPSVERSFRVLLAAWFGKQLKGRRFCLFG